MSWSSLRTLLQKGDVSKDGLDRFGVDELNDNSQQRHKLVTEVPGVLNMQHLQYYDCATANTICQ